MNVLPPASTPTTSLPRLLDALLAEQRAWTAVDQFSRWHEEANQPFEQKERSYHRLIPLQEPKAGQQYAFEVDLDKCSGCKACVVACHSLNGLEETETWRSVGLLVGPPAVQQHVTTACHHCVDPGCLNGCPVLAYDKDPLTGVVRHLDDQCIGCQYCIMKCPYEVPQYSNRLGIVRKCDMCYNRLAVGEAPACAQACPSEAIRITIVEQSSIASSFRTGPNEARSKTPHAAPDQSQNNGRNKIESGFLPDSPSPSITLPATRFVSRNVALCDLKAADRLSLRLEQAHWPLVLMLLFSQAAAGLFLAASCLPPLHNNRRLLTVPALVLLSTGLFTALLHLGRPLKAWRAFLGWRTSWLSRELIFLSLFAAAASAAICLGSKPGWFGLIDFCAAFLGLLSVLSSGMVYVDTGRPAWAARFTMTNFLGSTFLLGTAFASALLALAGEFACVPLLGFVVAFRVFLFFSREIQWRVASGNLQSPIHLNARVVRQLLPWTAQLDALLLVFFVGASLLGFANVGGERPIWIALAAAMVFLAELLARWLFFVASAAKRMPGGVLA